MNRLNILLVEDNPGDVFLVRESLAHHNLEHDLHLATDGEMALKHIADMGAPSVVACPDLLLLDLNLPKVDGAAVLLEFRKHPQCAFTPVIVVTSSDMPKDRTQLAALGISNYFRKPTSFAAFMQLGAVIRQVIEDHGHRFQK
jgi:two-component system response regulator